MSLPAEQFFAAKMRGRMMLSPYAPIQMLDIGAYGEPIFKPVVEEDSIPNLLTDDGGNYETDTNITAITLTVNLYNFNPAMTARMLNGLHTNVATGAVANEVVVVSAATVNYLLPLEYMADTATPFVVTSADGLTTYDVNGDYIEHEGGIELVAGGQILTDADADASDQINIKVNYTRYGQDVIESAVDFSSYFKARFILGNKVRGSNPAICDIHKFKFVPGDFPLVDQTFKVKAVTLNLEADLTRGTGESAYMKFMQKTYEG